MQVVSKTPSTAAAVNSLTKTAATSSSPSSIATPLAVNTAATVQADPVLSPPNGHSNGLADGKIIGNKNSKIYHLPGCSSYTKVSEKNQIKFESVEAAEKAGYKLAGNCSPDKNTRQ